jgi:hypothetical protein
VLRFVVLEHSWSGVHWDWMFEWGDRLRTWAADVEVRAGMTSAVRRLADHRLAYLDYEGPVSGDRGRVRRVDRGTFRPLVWEEERVSVRLKGSRYRGQLDLWSETSERAGEGSLERIWYLRLENVD